MPSSTKIIGHDWNLSSLWNQAAISLPERIIQPRDYIYASELGYPFIDRYLKMHAVKYSNPPNDRARRKFISGHVWEWVVGIVLTMCGVLKQKQLRGEVHLPGMLRVTGKLDFIAGGYIDWEKAREEAERVKKLFSMTMDDMPPFIMHAVDYVLSAMQKSFGANPIREIIIENKAVSSFVFERIQKTQMALLHHSLQTGHYVIANNLPAQVNYLSKDDCLMEFFPISATPQLKKLYAADVATMTGYYASTNKKNPMKSLPPKEPELFFTPGVWRFEKNTLGIEYSNYLTLIYGYKTPQDYRDRWEKSIQAWNRVFRRIVNGDNMTASNLSYIGEMRKAFPDLDRYVQQAKKAGAFQQEAEVEDE